MLAPTGSVAPSFTEIVDGICGRAMLSPTGLVAPSFSKIVYGIRGRVMLAPTGLVELSFTKIEDGICGRAMLSPRLFLVSSSAVALGDIINTSASAERAAFARVLVAGPIITSASFTDLRYKTAEALSAPIERLSAFSRRTVCPSIPPEAFISSTASSAPHKIALPYGASVPLPS